VKLSDFVVTPSKVPLTDTTWTRQVLAPGVATGVIE
jgi:hypothetical protein